MLSILIDHIVLARNDDELLRRGTSIRGQDESSIYRHIQYLAVNSIVANILAIVWRCRGHANGNRYEISMHHVLGLTLFNSYRLHGHCGRCCHILYYHWS